MSATLFESVAQRIEPRISDAGLRLSNSCDFEILRPFRHSPSFSPFT